MTDGNLDGRLWHSLTNTPGIGVSLTTAEGDLLYVNEQAMRLFEGQTGVDYTGKNIADFHSRQFVEERLALLRRVIESQRPLSITHIYRGIRIQSTLWPIQEKGERFPDRVLVVSRQVNHPDLEPADEPMAAPQMVESSYIELGHLNVLTPRELEILVLLGHGQSVPQVAKILHRSQKTIERHREAIGRKLEIHSQAELVRIVQEVGLTIDDIVKQRIAHGPDS